MRPLDDWDADYVATDVKMSDELATLEKKASGKFVLAAKGQPDGSTRDELAKQVSAFSNAGQGFIVYGIDDNKSLDAGIPLAIGGQSTKDWVEAIIPKLVYPPVTHCEAKTIQVPGHHSTDRAVLVVSVPLSERRPHWTTSQQEIGYIRAGAHSVPMRPQTLLDLSSRGTASATEIESLNSFGAPNFEGTVTTCKINPSVRLVSGPVCERWGFELKIRSSIGKIQFPRNGGAKINIETHLYLVGTEPLFPSRSTRVSEYPFTISYDRAIKGGILKVEATLYAGSAQPVSRVFDLGDLDPGRELLQTAFTSPK